MKQNDVVFVIGVIVGITRKLDRNGKAFAIVSLEDFSGKIDCVFWSDSYREYQNLVVDEQPIAIQGKVRKGGVNDVPNIIVTTASEITGIRKKSAKGVILKLESRDEIEKTVQELKALCLKHRGNCTTYVAVENPDEIIRRDAINFRKVFPSQPMIVSSPISKLISARTDCYFVVKQGIFSCPFRTRVPCH